MKGYTWQVSLCAGFFLMTRPVTGHGVTSNKETSAGGYVFSIKGGRSGILEK